MIDQPLSNLPSLITHCLSNLRVKTITQLKSHSIKDDNDQVVKYANQMARHTRLSSIATNIEVKVTFLKNIRYKSFFALILVD